MQKIRWSNHEVEAVTNALIEVIGSDRLKKTSKWSSLMAKAQKVLPPSRRHDSATLGPSHWTSSKDQVVRFNGAHQIIVVALSKFGLSVATPELPTCADVLDRITTKSQDVPKGDSLRIVTVTESHIQRIVALEKQVRDLSAQVNNLVDFVTGHGYQPKV